MLHYIRIGKLSKTTYPAPTSLVRDLCNKRNHPEVMRFCELIVELMNETASIYVQMECTHDARPSNNNDIKNVIPQMTSHYSYFSDSQRSTNTHASQFIVLSS